MIQTEFDFSGPAAHKRPARIKAWQARPFIPYYPGDSLTTDLERASFVGADICFANFVGADLTKATFSGSGDIRLPRPAPLNATPTPAHVMCPSHSTENVLTRLLAFFTRSKAAGTISYSIFAESILDRADFSSEDIENTSFNTAARRGAGFVVLMREGGPPPAVMPPRPPIFFSRPPSPEESAFSREVKRPILTSYGVYRIFTYEKSVPAGAGPNFSGDYLKNVTFNSANLTGASFENTTLDGVSFLGACLNGVSFRNATIGSADFQHAVIDDFTDFTGVTWPSENDSMTIQNLHAVSNLRDGRFDPSFRKRLGLGEQRHDSRRDVVMGKFDALIPRQLGYRLEDGPTWLCLPQGIQPGS